MSKENTILDNYFVYISNFSHDKAKEVVEKERDVARVSSGSSWSQLVSVLISLSNVEKTYHSLTFLIPRSGSVFLRKDPSLKSVYQSLIVDCRNAMEAGPTSDRRSELSQVCDDLARIFQVRARMTDIYERLCNLTQQAFLTETFSVEIPSLTTILTELKKNKSKVLGSWLLVLKYEVEVMLDFLTLILTMQDFNFFDSIILLQRAGETLNKWDEVVQVIFFISLFISLPTTYFSVCQARETRKLGFASSWLRVSGSVEPQLYTWFQRLKSSLLSKFSLYFHSTLSGQTNTQEMRSLCSKLSTDQTARLSSFQKRLDAGSVSILYDANGQPGYQVTYESFYCYSIITFNILRLIAHQGRPGNHFHDKDQVSLSGLDLFPLVYSAGFPPGPHWPNVVMIISDHSEELLRDSTVTFYDMRVEATYFLHQIEPRFYVVIVFDGRKNEKDSTINSFIQDTAISLRCSRNFSSLKPGFK